MTPLHLKVRGSIGIKKGLNTEEVEIDFTKVSGLVALSGNNGQGKTTVLEFLSPFAEVISRESNHLADNFYLKDSYKDYTFEYSGIKYRELIKIDPHTRKLEGYIWKNDEPQVNGKISTFKKYINNLMGSPTLFYNSVFCSQNAEKISEMKEGDLRSLFREFVGADRYEEWSKTASDVSKHFTNQKKLEESKLEIFTEDEEKLSTLNIEKEDSETNIVNLENDQDLNSISLEDNKLCSEFYEKEKNNQIIFEKDRKNLQEKLDENQKASMEVTKESGGKKLIIEDNIEKVEAEKVTNNAIYLLKEKYDESNESIEILKNVIETHTDNAETEKLSLFKLEKELSEIDLKISGLKGSVDAEKLKKETKTERFWQIKENIASYEKEMNERPINKEISDIESTIKGLEQQIIPLKSRPVECSDDDCSFVKSALEAKRKLSLLYVDSSALHKTKNDLDKITNKLIDELKIEQNKVVDSGKKIAEKIVEIEKEISDSNTYHTVKSSAIKLIKDKIESNSERIKAHEKNITEIKEEVKDIDPVKIQVAEEKIHDLNSQLVKLSTEKQTLESETDKKLLDYLKKNQVILSDIAKIPEKKDYSEDIAKNERMKKTIDSETIWIDSNLNSNKTDLKIAENKIEEINERLKAKISITDRINRLNKEISRWEYLKIQTGKKGLQAIEIDGATPLIMENCNSLLSGSFGSNFSVKIVTQCPETGKEIFDIIIIDENGEESSFGSKSGGEQTYLLKALRLGMTLVSASKSGRTFETSFSDEEGSALDKGKSEKLIDLYRAFMIEGNFKTTFLISHDERVVSMCDYQLQFSGNRIEVI